MDKTLKQKLNNFYCKWAQHLPRTLYPVNKESVKSRLPETEGNPSLGRLSSKGHAVLAKPVNIYPIYLFQSLSLL